ncbi:ubiquinol-cytochrome c reductase subunit 7, partial [Tremellales sp. Uapishka_1]
MIGGPLGISLAPQIKAASGGLYKALKPLANAYANIVGHRAVGLKYDDLIIEEREDVKKALSRLPPREAYDRAFRMRVAIQQSLLHKPLPKEQWVKATDDNRYLAPIVKDIVDEAEERTKWDTMIVERKK